jgi:hypothetical protein
MILTHFVFNDIMRELPQKGGNGMKRSTLFMLALTLIGTGAFAQGLPSSTPTAGATPGAPASGTAGFGTSSGVQNIQDPYGTAAAARRFGTPGGGTQQTNP